jgi:MFS family permease
LALGITIALQFGPLLVFGLFGGVIADRFDRRRLLIATQSTLALLAAAVGLLVVTHLIQLWMLWTAVLLLGLSMSIDKPGTAVSSKTLSATPICLTRSP